MKCWGVPDAMWFCFFSSSVRRGLSSAPGPSAGGEDIKALSTASLRDEVAGCYEIHVFVTRIFRGDEYGKFVMHKVVQVEGSSG